MQRIFYNPEAKNATVIELLTNFAYGAALSGIMQGTQVVGDIVGGKRAGAVERQAKREALTNAYMEARARNQQIADAADALQATQQAIDKPSDGLYNGDAANPETDSSSKNTKDIIAFQSIKDLDDFKTRIPSNAKELPWKNVDGGAVEGVRYRWTDTEGNTWNVRAHSIDPSAPFGSNASKGWVYRVEVRWGGTGKKYFMDSLGKFHPENVIRPSSPMYNEAIANDTHITFDNR